jgi:hypothetical protein
VEDRDRLGLALQGDRLQGLVVEDLLGGGVGPLAHGHPVHRGLSLQPGGRVDHVAGDDPFPLLGSGPQGHHGLPGLDPHPDGEVKAGIALVQLGDGLDDPKARPHCSLRVVLVRGRSPEHRYDRVADELLHGAAVALDLASQAGVVGPDPGSHILGICLVGCGREPHQVAEQHGNDLALLGQRAWGHPEGSGAEPAEGEAFGVVLATTRAGCHRLEHMAPDPVVEGKGETPLPNQIVARSLLSQAPPTFS